MVGNKRGWMRILEATVAVMIVAGVLVVVYSGQVDRGIEPADYFYSLQRQILMDVSSSSDLRLAVLNVATEEDSDVNFKKVNDFIGGKIPEAFGYSIRICEFGSQVDFCKMKNSDYIATRKKDVFVEEVVISSELGVGGGIEIYEPKKLRLFVWEKR
jgi:hypothetical protein